MSDKYLTLYVKNEEGDGVVDPLFLKIANISKSSQYPGGLYSTASFVIPTGAQSRAPALIAGYEVTLQEGVNTVYHGFVESVEDVSVSGRDALKVSCIGAWGWIMEKRGIERNWADTRIDAGTWEVSTGVGGAELATVDREDRIRITPKAETWGNNVHYRLSYNTPTGETIGKITNAYDMQESGQAWDLELHNGTGAEWNITTSSTGTQDVDLGTSVARLNFYSRAGQTPTADGTYYGEVSNLIVFSEVDHSSRTLGNMDAYEVALDIVDLLGVDDTEISSSTAGLDSTLTESIIPFVSNGYESFGSQLARIASYGDTSQNPIGFSLRPPFEAPDNLPLLRLETYPDLSDYDYEASVDELGLAVRLNVDDVWNYIVVEYTNRLGNTKTYTPGDDATLEDTDSQALYGLRYKKVTLPLANDQIALAYGQRYLARHKDPTYAVTRPVEVSRLRAKNGGFVPASQIDAGQRLRVVDLPNITNQSSAGGVTFLITKTDYNHDRREVSLSIGGRPDDLAIWLAYRAGRIPD